MSGITRERQVAIRASITSARMKTSRLVNDGMSTPSRHGQAITPAGLKALRAELAELEAAGRAEVAERINAARQIGDLKENAEYHIAKEQQAHLETKIRRLRQRLRDAVVVEGDPVSTTLAFGGTAEVLDEESGQVHTWTIVGTTEADLSAGKLSAESPVARALLGAGPGKTVAVTTPRGTRSYRIQKLVA